MTSQHDSLRDGKANPAINQSYCASSNCDAEPNASPLDTWPAYTLVALCDRITKGGKS